MEQYARELMRRAVKPKEYRPVIADGRNDIWGLDLADMSEWHKVNDGYKYILCAIDVFSRYAWCRPLRTKEPKEVWSALESIFKDSGSHPKHLWLDQGGEFYNALWTKNLKKLDIDRYSTFGPYKVSTCERFIRTLKTKIWFHILTRGTHKWIDVLQPIVDEYNKTKHSSIQMTPTEAAEPENEDKLLDKIVSRPPGKPKYQLGQWVRISRLKGLFEKGFHPNWSYELYKIVGIRTGQPVMYELDDYDGKRIQGAFYESELQPTADSTFYPIEKTLKERTRNGVREVYVKYLGFKDPMWIPKSDIIGNK